MKVNLLDFSGDDPAKPEIIGTAWLDAAKAVVFDSPMTERFFREVAADENGEVTPDEPERFIRCLPRAVSGSMLRADLIEIDS